MFESILVPVDLTPKNRRAVETARELASRPGGRVTLLHVIETLDLPFDELREFYERLEARATALIDHCRGLIAAYKVPKIVEFAEEGGFDLIILDSHRVRPGEPGKGITTISYRVAILASCPVLLVKGRPRTEEGS